MEGILSNISKLILCNSFSTYFWCASEGNLRPSAAEISGEVTSVAGASLFDLLQLRIFNTCVIYVTAQRHFLG